MRKLIRNGLINIRNKNMKTYEYQYECNDRGIITMKGSVKMEMQILSLKE